LRDEREALAPATPTPFGFKLAGNTSMASDVFRNMVTGEFEKDEIEVFLKHLKSASVCIDIGANIGLYTCLAASHGKHVVAVEPLASNLNYLYRNLVCGGFVDVEVVPMGLGSKGGISRLFGGGPHASFLQGWSGTKIGTSLAPVSTLDTIVNTRFDGLPLLIKMDVEGFEGEVLQGANRTLSLNPRPTWLVEICLNGHHPGGLNDKFYETFEVFWRHGYQAAIAATEQRPVRQCDVTRWAKQGFVDFGSYNYLFFE